jgi:CRP-like cAMP-binding protein
MRPEEADEQFYRDTESIAFPQLSDEHLETLESLGRRRSVKRGEIIYKAGQRDVPFNLVLSGRLRLWPLTSARPGATLTNRWSQPLAVGMS